MREIEFSLNFFKLNALVMPCNIRPNIPFRLGLQGKTV